MIFDMYVNKKLILVLLFLTLKITSFTYSHNKNILLIPFNEYDTSDQLLRPDSDNYWYQLKLACDQAGYLLTTRRHLYNSDQIDIVIAFNAPRTSILIKYPKAKKILYTWEPPSFWPLNFIQQIHDQFDMIATWHDGLIDNKKYFKFNYALLFHPPKKTPPFHGKKLCCMFAGNKQSRYPGELYSKRGKLVMFFENNASYDFDLFGPGWPQQLKSYRGFAQDKVSTMSNYKFAIIFENISTLPGYITEKIFDAFSAGCVPIYWGASNISQHIPDACYISREKFANNFELYNFLKNMTEQEYTRYLNSITSFLKSKEAYLFSREKYIETFMDMIKKVETIEHEKNI